MRNGIVVVVEGVNTGLVGTYGSNTAVTPSMDRLAAHGLVLDQCFVDSLDLRQQLHSLWTGGHAAQACTAESSIWHSLSSNGYETCLITDCAITAKVAEELGCPRVTLVEVDESAEPADDWTECSLMRVFVTAIDELSETESNRVVWIHSRGLRLNWDAPIELRQRFMDPEDPDPPAESRVPNIEVTPDTDPDEVIGWAQVAAAQVAVVDQAIDILMTTIESRDDASDWAWMVVSPGGVPLGEHGRVGWGSPGLHGEELGCLAILRPAETQADREDNLKAPGTRRAELCQLPDLMATFLDLLDLTPDQNEGRWGKSMLRLESFSVPFAWPADFQSAYTANLAEQWIRTPAWSATFREEGPPQLFVKPDDRWEISDVSTRRGDVVERLQKIANAFRECLSSGKRDQLPKLEDDLCNLLR